MKEPQADFADLRELDFYGRVPESLIFNPKIPSHHLRVYAALDRHLNKQTGRCFPGQRGIAARTGLSRSTVQKALDFLEAHHYIKIFPPEKPGDTSTYKLMPVRSYKGADLEAIRESAGVDREEVQGGVDRVAGQGGPRSGPGVDRVAGQGGPRSGPGVDRVAVRNHSKITKETNQRKKAELTPEQEAFAQRLNDLKNWWMREFFKRNNGAKYDFKGAQDQFAARKILSICEASVPPIDPKDFISCTLEDPRVQNDRFLGPMTKNLHGISYCLNQLVPRYARQKTSSTAYPKPIEAGAEKTEEKP